MIIGRIINSKYFKGIVPPAISFVLALLGNALFSLNETGDHITIKRFLCIFFMIVLLAIEGTLIVFYIKKEKNKNNTEELLRNDINNKNEVIKELSVKNNVLLNSLKGFQKNFDTNSGKFYKIIQYAREKKIIDLNIWNRDMISDYICTSIKDILSAIAEKGNSLSVNIIIPKEKNKKILYFMISDDSNGIKPSIYHCELDENEAQKYYFGRLFKKQISDYDLLMTPDEINSNFYFRDISHRGKYEQYVAFPIFCDAHHMIGLLEICSAKGTIIASSKEKMEEIIKDYVLCYADYYLMSYKIEKAVSFVPEKGGQDNEKGLFNSKKRKN